MLYLLSNVCVDIPVICSVRMSLCALLIGALLQENVVLADCDWSCESPVRSLVIRKYYSVFSRDFVRDGSGKKYVALGPGLPTRNASFHYVKKTDRTVPLAVEDSWFDRPHIKPSSRHLVAVSEKDDLRQKS